MKYLISGLLLPALVICCFSSCEPNGPHPLDRDNDGFRIWDDCDDSNELIYPGAPEVCNGVDDNCDGVVDEGYPKNLYYLDSDQDEYGDPSAQASACAAPKGYVDNSRDCNDNDVNVNPDATEVCDGVDNNCDGTVDEGFDVDGDKTSDCVDDDGDGYTEDQGDCDDLDSAVHPDAAEVCDGVDNNCNAQIDEGVPIQIFYRDEDHDGYGNPNSSAWACGAPDDYVSNKGDCNDADGSINPASTEICDELDNDCDGQVDENLSTFGPDLDGDGWTNDEGNKTCNKPHDFQGSGDCNDSIGTIHPGATELCNGRDDNCDGRVDEGCP